MYWLPVEMPTSEKIPRNGSCIGKKICHDILRFLRQTGKDTTKKNINGRNIIHLSGCQGHLRAADAETLDSLQVHDIFRKQGNGGSECSAIPHN